MAAIENTRIEPEELEVFHRVVELALEYIEKNYDKNEPIVRFRTPEELRKEVDIPIGEKGVGFKGIVRDLEASLRFSVRTGHVHFYNQLWAGTDKAAVIGEWLTAVMNSSMYTYEVSPVFSIMELYILQRIRDYIGWKDGDGAFAPGGANCNLLALLAARNRALPSIKTHGFAEYDKLVGFTSEQSHYTIERAASVMGMGLKNSIKVKCDRFGKMIPAELEKAIEKAKAEGKKPIYINATAGSTVLGAYDDLNALAAIAQRHGIWLHVDACWGGHCLLSNKHRSLMAGVEKVDSVAWTATKCFGLPQQCALVVLPKRNTLHSCNACNQDYLFHEHEQKDYDLGERTLNCGRRVDAFKLWVSWKVYGEEGFRGRVDHAFDLAQHLASRLKADSSKWELLVEPESLNVCFWYVPASARGLTGLDRYKALDNATLTIRNRMQKVGKFLINYSDLPGVHGHFFRMITCNPNATTKDMDELLAHIEELGKDL